VHLSTSIDYLRNHDYASNHKKQEKKMRADEIFFGTNAGAVRETLKGNPD